MSHVRNKHRRDIEKRSKARRRKRMGEDAWRLALWLKNIKYLYGLTKEKFDALAYSQGNLCICGRNLFGSNRRPHVDHNPTCCPRKEGKRYITKTCGKCVRGILCFRCNVVLGLYKNEPRLLPNYLKRYVRKHALPKA